MLDENTAEQKLIDNGIMRTIQRVMIARVILGEHQHLSADDVGNLLQKHKMRISKATIYNTLTLFVTKGLLAALTINPKRLYYDTNVEPHHHFHHVVKDEFCDIPFERIAVTHPKPPHGTEVELCDVVLRISSR